MVSGNPFKFVLVNLSLYADLIWTGIRCQGYESTNPKVFTSFLLLHLSKLLLGFQDSHGFLNDLQGWELSHKGKDKRMEPEVTEYGKFVSFLDGGN